MAKKWSEIRGKFSPEEEARIRQKAAGYESVMAHYALETDPKLRELAETDSDAYLQIKQASRSSGPISTQQ